MRTLYVIGDGVDGGPLSGRPPPAATEYRQDWQLAQVTAQRQSYLAGLDLAATRAALRVEGGYMERLPLACVKAGLVDYAEIWHYQQDATACTSGLIQPLLGGRTFALPEAQPPFASPDMLAFLETSGAPDILCVWGLGVSEQILRACPNSFKIYYSLDVPPLRIPPAVSRHFNLILVGEERDQRTVRAQHPAIPCELLAIGPEFADGATFRPLGIPKEYDLIYVAAAEPYKRHDILWDALSRSPRSVRCLCVLGRAADGSRLRAEAAARGLAVDFLGPPRFGPSEVNYQMNRARVGVVAGIEDGCPAILTEYMLAGLPVLANSQLCCGLRYITPTTGMTADPAMFHEGIAQILERWSTFDPRPAAEAAWGWPTSVRRLTALLSAARDTGARSAVPRSGA